MAHSRNNVITRTYSGKFGNTCMQSDGILRSRPNMTDRILSEKQKQHLSRFELAKEYARQVVADAEKSANYVRYLKKWKKNKKKNIGIYQLAISDFTHPPKIHNINCDKYNMVNILARGEFGLVGATLSLVAPDGAILEEGNAIDDSRYRFLQYIVKDPSLLRQGVLFRARVWGMPGVISEKDFPCKR